MRLLLRFALFGLALLLGLVWLALRSARHANNLSLEQDDADEAIRLLMATGDNEQASAGLVPNPNKAGVHPVNELTFNVAVVMVVSLLSVALLITGIIVVAVSLDPGDNKLEIAISETNLLARSDQAEWDESHYDDLCVDQEQDNDTMEWDREAGHWR